MMDSFVEAIEQFKARQLRGVRHSVQNAAKPRNSLLVHACGHEVTGLKTYRGPKRKQHLGMFLTWFPSAGSGLSGICLGRQTAQSS
jgi:hypothetical protein